MEAPVWTKEFQCRGHESALLDCDSSDTNTCSSGKAVGLTCSEPDNFQLARGSSRCSGELEMKNDGERHKVDVDDPSAWNLKAADVLYSVRLVNGTSLCSGRLEVKSNQSNQSNQSWSSVCEDDFDLQDAEVVCRELGCGAPSVLQGALYGDMEAPVWTKEFQCRGHESALLDCDSSDRNTCSSGKAVGLTCSESDNLRLVRGSSRCAGGLEIKKEGKWHKVDVEDSAWNVTAADVCRHLDCGSAVSTGRNKMDFNTEIWRIRSTCLQSKSAVAECILTKSYTSHSNLEIICSDLLAQPNISFSTHIDGVSEATQQGLRVLMGSDFTISCSILPQYPGGSFQLIFNTSDPEQKTYTLPAVNHTAHFLFSAAGSTHRGEYRCVYHLYVFSHNFSSESRLLHLTLAASLTELIIRLVVLLLGMMSLITALCVTSKASRKQKLRRVKNSEI
ncbi:scavenger receptor cysteine-rich type 1 protein M130 [Perca flavescens]|uniref:scavenger receptor cysteine-rich type 1 protein M130 n=1 Tax=Perca flavescens TaxID=8167 RepID=UPI00106ECCA5|nr:scavenger receptor cysteine-rich type 1 protein M130-like [Perca flavescens]